MIPQYKRTPTSVETFTENENEEKRALRQSYKEALQTIEWQRKRITELEELNARKSRYIMVPVNPPFGA